MFFKLLKFPSSMMLGGFSETSKKHRIIGSMLGHQAFQTEECSAFQCFSTFIHPKSNAFTVRVHVVFFPQSLSAVYCMLRVQVSLFLYLGSSELDGMHLPRLDIGTHQNKPLRLP